MDHHCTIVGEPNKDWKIITILMFTTHFYCSRSKHFCIYSCDPIKYIHNTNNSSLHNM